MPGVVRYDGGASRGRGGRGFGVREGAGSVSVSAEALRSVEETRFCESFSERREAGFYYPRVGDGREILRGVFQLVGDVPKVLAPWRLAGFYRYYRNLESEVETSDVVFPSDGMSISGVLCRPKKEEKLPTIVLSVGINTKAKEMLLSCLRGCWRIRLVLG